MDNKFFIFGGITDKKYASWHLYCVDLGKKKK